MCYINLASNIYIACNTERKYCDGVGLGLDRDYSLAYYAQKSGHLCYKMYAPTFS